jgi:hypothetical protein
LNDRRRAPERPIGGVEIVSKRRSWWFLVAFLFIGLPSEAPAQEGGDDLDALRSEIDVLDGMFPAFTWFPWTEEGEGAAFLYGDTKGIVHHYVSDDGRLREKWKSFPLEGTVRKILGEDLDGDGGPEIIAYTGGARIYVWDIEKYELLWESVEQKFEAIQAMVVADVDRDPAREIIVCADNKIVYYDGVEFFREKEGRDFVDPAEMLVADVDGDLTLEIVTNDGYVLDTNTLTIEWATEAFGHPISLFDLDNDGVLDVVGEVGGAIKFWDIEERREIW